MKCSICGKEIEGFGNNPSPFDRDVCCDECNQNIVLPLRLYLTGMTKGLLMIGNDSITYHEVKGKVATLEELQKLVEGYIEIYPKHDEKYLYLVDEEGLLKGKPFNSLAYELFEIKAVGNVVVCPQELFE